MSVCFPFLVTCLRRGSNVLDRDVTARRDHKEHRQYFTVTKIIFEKPFGEERQHNRNRAVHMYLISVFSGYC